MERLPQRIEGDGLVLQRWEVDDAPLLGTAVAASAEHLRPWMPWMASEPLGEQARRGLLSRWQREWEAGGDSILGAFLDGEVAGSFGLHRRRGPQTLEIGYWVHVAHLRRGVATRAAGLLSEAALALPGITRVEIHHDKANTASAGVPRKLGYRFLGEVADRPEAPGEIGIDCGWRLEPGEIGIDRGRRLAPSEIGIDRGRRLAPSEIGIDRGRRLAPSEAGP